MITLTVPGPVPSFLEVYEMVRSRLREENMPDANFTIQDRHGRIVGLQEVQQGGDFQIMPGSNIHSNPAMPYEFTDFYSPVVDQRGNNYPELLPDNITPSMVNDMIEQHGLFNAVCNLISALNTPRISTSGRTTAASIAMMRSRLVHHQTQDHQELSTILSIESHHPHNSLQGKKKYSVLILTADSKNILPRKDIQYTQ